VLDLDPDLVIIYGDKRCPCGMVNHPPIEATILKASNMGFHRSFVEHNVGEDIRRSMNLTVMSIDDFLGTPTYLSWPFDFISVKMVSPG
jgi:hypothetical protein